MQKFNIFKAGIGLIAFFLFLLIGFQTFFIVEPGEVAFTKTFGKINETVWTEGFHFKLPIIQKVVITDIRDNKITVDATSSSNDLQDVNTKISINYAIQSDAVIQLHKDIGNERLVANNVVYPSIQESVKSATAQFKASELITKRSEVTNVIRDSLTSKLSVRGLRLAEVNIENFSFSQEFNEAIEQKVKAEQQAQKALNDLERVKAEAQADIERSKAEAEKIKIQAEAVTNQGGAEYVKLQRIAKRNGQLPTYMLGDDTSLLMQMGN